MPKLSFTQLSESIASEPLLLLCSLAHHRRVEALIGVNAQLGSLENELRSHVEESQELQAKLAGIQSELEVAERDSERLKLQLSQLQELLGPCSHLDRSQAEVSRVELQVATLQSTIKGVGLPSRLVDEPLTLPRHLGDQ